MFLFGAKKLINWLLSYGSRFLNCKACHIFFQEDFLREIYDFLQKTSHFASKIIRKKNNSLRLQRLVASKMKTKPCCAQNFSYKEIAMTKKTQLFCFHFFFRRNSFLKIFDFHCISIANGKS